MALAHLNLRLPEAILLRDTLRRETETLTDLDLSHNQLDARAVAASPPRDPLRVVPPFSRRIYIYPRARELRVILPDPLSLSLSLSLSQVVAGLARSHTRLRSLNLESNLAGPEGLRSLADMLLANRSLTTLKMATNDAGRDAQGVRRLLEVLRVNTTLTALDVAANDLSHDDTNELEARVSVNRALVHTPRTFIDMLDARYKRSDTTISRDGGYRLTLRKDAAYIEHEKRTCAPATLAFDDDAGDDYFLNF